MTLIPYLQRKYNPPIVVQLPHSQTCNDGICGSQQKTNQHSTLLGGKGKGGERGVGREERSREGREE